MARTTVLATLLLACGASSPAVVQGGPAAPVATAPIEDTPITLACPEVVYPPLDTRIVDPRRVRAGEGREVEVGDALEMLESVSAAGGPNLRDHPTHTAAARDNLGCGFVGMRRGEIRTWRVVQKNSPPRDERWQLVGFDGVPPRVLKRRPRADGTGAPLVSGDVVTIVRTIRIDGVIAEPTRRIEEAAYGEGMGSLLLGLRVGDHVLFEVEGLYAKSAEIPLYDPNVRQKIEVDVQVAGRKPAQAPRDPERNTPKSGLETCPPHTMQCPGGRRDSFRCVPLGETPSPKKCPALP